MYGIGSCVSGSMPLAVVILSCASAMDAGLSTELQLQEKILITRMFQVIHTE